MFICMYVCMYDHLTSFPFYMMTAVALSSGLATAPVPASAAHAALVPQPHSSAVTG